MIRKRDPKFGGLDLAKRIDASALEILTLKKGVLHHTAEKIWHGIDYKTVADDVMYIQKIEVMNLIGADATGVGDAVMDIFPKYMKKILRPIKFTMPKKLEMIDVVQQLFQNNLLQLHPKFSSILTEEILEQERTKTDAGNIKYQHPAGSHDDRFWALAEACYVAAPYVYGLPKQTISVGVSPRDEMFDLSPF